MKSFSELKISPTIMKSIVELGYTIPSPIQAQALPLLLGNPIDFIGLAATGTGKTAAFGIPLLEQVDPEMKVVQGLILCPTRELAMQVSGQINILGKYKGIRSVCIYGGGSYGDQLHGLKSGNQIVVGTPGRLVDHLERGTLKLGSLKTLVLDEADEMISMGFKEDLEIILKGTPQGICKTWLFSATMSRDVRKVADTYLKTPQVVQVNRTEVLSTTVEQVFYATKESNKPEILCKIIEAASDFYGIIFCQTKSLVTDLTQYLTERGYKVDNLHGDKDQRSRERTTQAFRDRKVKILICTDVASRGLDVKDVTHVINYSIPRELDSYVHRIGRTARSGKNGIAISLVTPSHRHLIGRIEQITKSRIPEGVLPTRKDIGTKKAAEVLVKFKEQKLFARASELMNDEWKETIAKMSPEEIVGRFLILNFPDLFKENEVRTKIQSADEKGLHRDRDYGPKKSSQGRFIHHKRSSHKGGNYPPRRRDR
jgi:ATP-dependent RNA helicase DeaD